MDAYFSPKGGCEQAITLAISNATQSVDIAMYSFTNQAIAQSILDANYRLRNNPSPIHIIFDRTETHGTQATYHDQFAQAGIPIKLYSPPRGILHDKYAIIDSATVINGSFNWTEKAENCNYENIQIHSDPELAQAYTANFEQLWQLASPEVQKLRFIIRPLRKLRRNKL